jgi:hypothetical protein
MSNEYNLTSLEMELCRWVSGEKANKPEFQLSDVEGILFNNEIVPHVCHAMKDSGCEIPDQLWSEHEATQTRIQSYLDELDTVASNLKAIGIPLVALKNAGIARGIYPCAGCSPMGDIDVLVRKGDFRRAHQVMLESGYTFEFRSPLEEAELDEAEQDGGAEYWKMLDNGEKLWFELQWRPVSGRWIRPDQEPSSDELIEHSISIPQTDARLLSPEDNLLQVALHTAKHTYVRAPGFRLHTDVDRIVRFQEIDWDLFVQKAKQMQVLTASYFSLAIPAEIFKTPVPKSVLQSLEPSRWKKKLMQRRIAAAGLFNPQNQKFSRFGYILFNSLLYDNYTGLLRGIFPTASWMKQRYGFGNNLLLPYYHSKRIFELLFRRVKGST